MWKHLRTCVRHATPLIVVPATAGHRRFWAKVAPRGRWPLVTGNGHYAPLCQIKNTHQTAYIPQHMHNSIKHNIQWQYWMQWDMKRTQLKMCEKATVFIHRVTHTCEHTRVLYCMLYAGWLYDTPSQLALEELEHGGLPCSGSLLDTVHLHYVLQ